MDAIQRRDRSPLTASDLLAGVMSDGGEQVLANLIVVELLMASLECAERAQPGVGVDVLDLVVGERAAEGATNQGPGGPFQLLVQPRGSLPPCARRRGSNGRGAGSRNRRHTRLQTIRTPPSRRAPPVTSFPPLVHVLRTFGCNHSGPAHAPVDIRK